MPYHFLRYKIFTVAEDSTEVLPPIIQGFPDESGTGVLGDRKRIEVYLTADGDDTFENKTLSFRWRMYGPNTTGAMYPSIQGFTALLKSQYVDLKMQIQGGSSNLWAKNKNLSAYVSVEDDWLSATISWTCYLTSDAGEFSLFNWSNLNRFLASRDDGEYMRDEANTAFRQDPNADPVQQSNVIVAAYVTDFVKPIFIVDELSTGIPHLNIPIDMRWFDRDLGSNGWNWRVNEFKVTNTGGTVTARKLANLEAPYNERYDLNFTESGNSLNYYEDNFVYFKIGKTGAPAGAIISDVRALLLRVDDIDDFQDMVSDYEMDVALLPASQTTNDAIGNLISGPASKVFSLSNTRLEVKFRIPRLTLVPGARYRILLNLYATATGDVFANASHELYVNYHPQIFPQVRNWIADPWIEQPTDHSVTAYHDPLRIRTEIAKQSIQDAFQYYYGTGMNAPTFDGSVRFVRAVVSKNAGPTSPFMPSQVKFYWNYIQGRVIGPPNLFDNGTDVFKAGFYWILDEEITPPLPNPIGSALYRVVRWEIGINGIMPNGDNVLLQAYWYQWLIPRRWEQEGSAGAIPFVLDADLYRDDEIHIIPPGTVYVCNDDEVVFYATKGESLLNKNCHILPAYYRETGGSGVTDENAIFFENPFNNGFIPVTDQPLITQKELNFESDNVMSQGSGDNDGAFRLAIKGFDKNSKWWATMIARQVIPNLCPLIAPATPATVTVSRASNISTVVFDWSGVYGALVSAATGGVTVDLNAVINPATLNLTGIIAGSSSSTGITITVDHDISPQLKRVRGQYKATATVLSAGITHLVQYAVEFDVTLPTGFSGGVTTNIPLDSFTCFDKGA